MSLRLDWCSHAAAKYAVEKWHYSKTMPRSRVVQIGAWECGRFIGAVLFSHGANKNIGNPYGLQQIEICELTRVALTKHETPTSRIVATAIRMLCKQSPGLRLLVSYADPEQGHIGGIYQAMNWVYVGKTQGGTAQIAINGHRIHKRTAFDRYGSASALINGGTWVQPEEKHKYLYPLDKVMKAQIAPLAKPYPKRAASIDSDASGVQSEEGSANLTATLHVDDDPITAE